MIFDGPNQIIQLEASDGDSVNVIEVYSRWKDWVQAGNSQYAPAMTNVGGDPITMILFLGSTFFMENGWKIRPRSADHELEVLGNLYSRDGSNPITSPSGTSRVLVTMRVSNLIDTVATGGGTGPDEDDIADAVWAHRRALTVAKYLAMKGA